MKKLIANILKKFNCEISKIPQADTYIVSFPKCGRTWLNILLGKLFEQSVGLSGLSSDILLNSRIFNSFFSDRIPLVLFTHENNNIFFYPPNKIKKPKKLYQKSKVIFLVRDPRDVLISSYFEKTKRNLLGKRNKSFWKPFNGTISDYLYEKNGGIDTIIKFYNTWYENKSVPKDFLLLKYEDLHQDALKQLKRITDFIGLKDVNTEILTTAIEYASFSNLQKIEKQGGTDSKKLKPGNVNDKDSYKVRKGKVKGYFEYLNEKEIQYLNNKINNKLNPVFGYNT